MWGAKHGYGPFVQSSDNASLLLLTSFVGTASLMTLLVAAVMTERQTAEAEKSKLGSELGIHRRRIEDIVQHVPGIVWETSGKPGTNDRRVEFVSSHIEKMLGYSAEEWIATPDLWRAIVHPDDRERAAGEAAAIFASGKGGASRFGVFHREGQQVWVE